MGENDQEQMSEKLLLSFNEQFATNQNHHQAIFLQFLSAILATLLGYGYVYANTNYLSDMHEMTKINSNQTNYAIIHLIGTYFMSQLILILLGTVVLNIGYGFRRDQKVIYSIRLKYLHKAEYKKMFGSQSFNPTGQSFFNFQPEFNRMFFLGIYILQMLLALSFLLRLPHLTYYEWRCISHWITIPLYLVPIVWSSWLYCNYYKKYYWVMTDTDEFWLKDLFRKKANKKNKKL